MDDKKGAAKIVKNIFEPIGEAIKNEGQNVVRSSLDQVGLVNWLYGSEKKLKPQELEKIDSSDQSQKSNRIEQIRAELGSKPKNEQPHEGPSIKPAEQKPQGQNSKPQEPTRLQIEHHQEAQRLGEEKNRAEEMRDQRKQNLEQEEVNKKEVVKQKLETPIEAPGKAKSGPGAKPNKSKMQRRILQKSQTKGETRGGQGLAG